MLPGPCYERFKDYLERLGFTTYPTEFDCVYSKHPLVDIAAKMGSFHWAFEYKTENDSVSRGVEQVSCYSNFFDFVVLVCEKAFDHRNSQNYWELQKLGAGLWFYDLKEDKCILKKNPVIQVPEKTNRRLVSRRFAALARNSRPAVLGQEKLDLYGFVHR